MACPSASQCTAVDAIGQEVTFDPTSATVGTPITIDVGHPMLGVGCPSVAQCTAVDQAGREVTFNPASPSTSNPITVDAGQYLFGVACPAVSQCTAVDYKGREVTFNPISGGSSTPTTIDGGQRLQGVACPSTSLCVAVDSGANSVEGDPSGATGGWTLARIRGASALAGVSCSVSWRCVIVDAVGNAFVGISAPVNTAPPTISGDAIQGQTLRESHGSWTANPTSYNYQWSICNSAGGRCVAIAGATSQSYTLRHADVVHTIRVEEQATNAGGTGEPMSSAPTAVVRAPQAIAISTTRAFVSRGKTTIQLGCTGGRAGSVCRGTLSLAIHVKRRVQRRVHGRKRTITITQTITLARAGYTTAADHHKSITLRLNNGALTRLTHAPHHRLRVQATATLQRRTTAQRTITLQLQPRPSATSDRPGEQAQLEEPHPRSGQHAARR